MCRIPTSSESVEGRAALEALERLRALERELVEQDSARRSAAMIDVGDAVRRLGELGSPAGVLERAAPELGASDQFDCVLISQVADTLLVPRSIWMRGQSDDRATLEAITELRIRVHYPLIEAEVAQHEQVAIVDATNSGSRTPKGLTDVLQWQSYVVASLALSGRTVGLLHAGVARPERPDAFARTLVWAYAQGFAEAFERATLRELLARHRKELARAVQSISAWLTTQDDAGSLADGSVQAALTSREREVMRLLIRGYTNLAIANALLISEGTVKYHVKNILRKLQAKSRADAISRYLRAVQ